MLVLQLYILLQRVSFFCAIFWICSFIVINRIFLINPSKAKESDLYLGDISIIDGNSVAIKSWEKAVLGNVREFESNSNDIFDIIMRELENDK